MKDNIVDPAGDTIRRLQKGPGDITDDIAKFMSRIPMVMQMIGIARTALSAARVFQANPQGLGGLPSLSKVGEAEATKVDRHFKVNQLGGRRDGRMGEIDQVFLTMQRAIGYIPQGTVVVRDEPPEVAVGSFMFSWAGGYHMRSLNPANPAATWNGIPVTSVYLCPRARTMSDDAFAYAMVHELAHYVGPQETIIDFVYFHKDPALYRRIDPDIAYRNADCYSQFVFDANSKADFNVEKNSG